jgi:hypothetical protein
MKLLLSNKIRYVLVAITLGMSVSFFACGEDDAVEEDSTESISYSDVSTFISDGCGSCHGSSVADTLGGGTKLSTEAEVVSEAANMAKRIRLGEDASPMPPKGAGYTEYNVSGNSEYIKNLLSYLDAQ